MKVVGLTGGIGSGKSTVAAMFKDIQVPVYFSDIEAKKLMNSSDKIKSGLRSLFGEKAYENGILNRSYIAEIVFNNRDALVKLNKIVHPEVRKDFEEWTSKQEAAYVIQENPLIFENNSQKDFDLVITVTAPKFQRIQRVMKRDQMSEEQVLARMNNQMDDALKSKLSDFVIVNEKLQMTQERVLEIHEDILSQIP
ncbi:dephospho-CoA kinase [Lutimonas sp.]|uniref:dephospho-CoA kinase n=1 Tax=Lutimonas sp. TaxID=1872403 RepID=UPI003D9BF12E